MFGITKVCIFPPKSSQYLKNCSGLWSAAVIEQSAWIFFFEKEISVLRMSPLSGDKEIIDLYDGAY